ncbi:MAG TPA: hypothetical protein VNH53_02690 [Sphingomicrobium sp.]|jgi:hypothetical protein|nr:hypothetical protein [Sphingomicrobium sp.]
MANHFRSARRRIARADTHIKNVETGISVFMAQNPFQVTTERGTSQGRSDWIWIKLKQTAPFPDDIGDAAAEAADALRSALDHACFAVATVAGAENPKSTHFPFADDPTQLENVIKRKCRDLPHDFVDLLRDYKPYAGGNDLLWAFNKVRAGNQHRFLLDVAISANHTRLRGKAPHGDFVFGHAPPNWNPEKQEMLLAEGFGFDPDIDVSVDVQTAFRGAGPLTGKYVVPMLRELHSTVSEIVDDIETYAAAYRNN